MAMERTFSIIKPDAVQGNHIGAIVDRFEKAGLRVAASKLTRLDRNKCELFYAEHKERPFFKALVDYMISGPVVLMCLEGEGAIMKNRELMGATDPQKQLPAPFVVILRKALMLTPFTGVIALRARSANWRFSSWILKLLTQKCN